MLHIDAEAQRRLSRIKDADVLIGIPSFNSARTVGYVVDQCSRGLSEFFQSQNNVIFVSDGGSADSTVETVEEMKMPKGVELISCRYQGTPGKGSAVKAIFEASITLGIRSLALIDSDLQSITPDWIKLLISPTFKRAALVTPRYLRHKYDGTITNQLCYPLTRALYGKRVRQPIGGDFGLSIELTKKLIESPLWQTPYIPRFGIDIFITSSALAEGFTVEEADLGVKIHETKDPALSLASMFREVTGSAFSCIEAYEKCWRTVKSSVSLPLHKDHVKRTDPPPIGVSLDRMIQDCTTSYQASAELRSMLSPDLRKRLDTSILTKPEDFGISTETWARTVFESSAQFKRSDAIKKNLILDGLKCIWSARVATFVRDTASITSEEAEVKVEEDAVQFEKLKSELLKIY
jgi:hypothetical protein